MTIDEVESLAPSSSGLVWGLRISITLDTPKFQKYIMIINSAATRLHGVGIQTVEPSYLYFYLLSDSQMHAELANKLNKSRANMTKYLIAVKLCLLLTQFTILRHWFVRSQA